MKKFIGMILCLLAVQAVYSQSLLKLRTPVKLKTETVIRSNDHDSVRIVVAEEVRDTSGSVVLIAAGTPVYCWVYREKSGCVCKAGVIKVFPVFVFSVDRQAILLDGMFLRTGKRGKRAVLPAGTLLDGMNTINTYYVYPE